MTEKQIGGNGMAKRQPTVLRVPENGAGDPFFGRQGNWFEVIFESSYDGFYITDGNAITLTDLLEEVPIDSARFLFNMHDAGSGIDFDLDQAVKTDNDNPVYYVQYAHARICSILKKMESEGVAFAGAENIDATLLTEPSEMDLIRMLAAFPQEIVMAAEKYDPSRINRFVIDLASAFHRFYGNCRIQGADPAVQQARLALCIGVKNVIFNVLTMFKINVPEKM